MGKAQNIIGQKYGKLTVVNQEISRKYGKPVTMCECHCECGNSTESVYSALINGKRTSCGCDSSEKLKKDYTGNRFGALVVIEKIDNEKNDKPTYLCQCDCGKIVEIKSSTIKQRSCGCITIQDRRKDYTGMKFGMLTLLERISNGKEKDYSTDYLCLCDCGTLSTHRGASIVNGMIKSCGCLREDKKKERIKEQNPQWKGGEKVAWFDTYAPQLEIFEEIRRSPENPNLLEVKCLYCGKWFLPTRRAVCARIQSIKSNNSGERRLYCSETCKLSCPIYKKVTKPSDFKDGTSYEVSSLLRKEVFYRDNYTCQRCGATDNLECHHILSATQYRFMDHDPENCITFCHECHKWTHSQDGCKYYELRCKNIYPSQAMEVA